MSTYADAAHLSGPAGAEKIPEPAKLEQTFTPGEGSNIQTAAPKEVEKLKKQGKEAAKEISKEAKKVEKDLKKSEGDALEVVKKYYLKVSALVQSLLASLSSSTVELTKTSQKELENPVVVAQVVAGASALAAGYVVYLERHRIKSDNPVVIGIHSAVITGLIGLDVLLFRKYYPQYKKD